MTLTCYHCGGTDFELIVLDNGETQIQCLGHEDHVAEHVEVDGTVPS